MRRATSSDDKKSERDKLAEAFLEALHNSEAVRVATRKFEAHFSDGSVSSEGGLARVRSAPDFRQFMVSAHDDIKQKLGKRYAKKMNATGGRKKLYEFGPPRTIKVRRQVSHTALAGAVADPAGAELAAEARRTGHIEFYVKQTLDGYVTGLLRDLRNRGIKGAKGCWSLIISELRKLDPNLNYFKAKNIRKDKLILTGEWQGEELSYPNFERLYHLARVRQKTIMELCAE